MLPRLPFAICCLVASALGVAAAQAPQPGQGSSLPPGAVAQQPEAALPTFEFHSGFWINLHHFLYRQARLRQRLPTRRSAGENVPPTGADLEPLKPLSIEEQKAWSAALDYYASAVADRDLFFDGDMVAINNRLAELETCWNLSGRASPSCAAGLRPELEAALEKAAPVYRVHWWPEQERANRAWSATVAPLVRQLGGTLGRQLAVIYQSAWPSEAIRVDVTAYAGRFGAYTSLDPLHITISSTDPRNQGPAALEVLFHEASHALAGAVRDTIARECRDRNKPIPRDLWHALLFYTTGEIVRRVLSAPSASAGRARSSREETAGDGPQAYTPYATRNGLYVRDWQNYERLLELYWQPYLDGQIKFSTALSRLVAAL